MLAQLAKEPEARMASRTAILSAVALCMCSLASATGRAQEPLRDAPLPTYDATEFTPDRFTVIERLWVESWRTAFWLPTHKDSSAAVAELTAEAQKIGAHALTDVVCLNDRHAWISPGYFCYGLAVKLK
jgi:hypothetical protein